MGFAAVFTGSGAGHRAGSVPDPGATAGTTRFLREDATWQPVPPAGGAILAVLTDDTVGVSAEWTTLVTLIPPARTYAVLAVADVAATVDPGVIALRVRHGSTIVCAGEGAPPTSGSASFALAPGFAVMDGSASLTLEMFSSTGGMEAHVAESYQGNAPATAMALIPVTPS